MPDYIHKGLTAVQLGISIVIAFVFVLLIFFSVMAIYEGHISEKPDQSKWCTVGHVREDGSFILLQDVASNTVMVIDKASSTLIKSQCN